MEFWLLVIGHSIASATLVAILWSIAFPSHRLWPPARYTVLTPVLVWVPTFVLFGVLITLGVMGWGDLGFNLSMRLGIGVPMILIGNVIVWSAVRRFGFNKTGGDIGKLQTDGLYRFSRNPQYMADIVIILGWMLLSAASQVLLLGLASIVVLIVAPFSEEPWLRSQYGSEFVEYAARVRRYI